MKTLITTILLAISISFCHGQKLKTSIDKFTKDSISETSVEVLSMPFKNALRFKIRKINNFHTVVFNIAAHAVFRIDVKDACYLLLDNDESLILDCVSGGIAEYDKGAGNLWLGSGTYSLSETNIAKIKSNKIVAVRLVLAEKKIEFNVKEKNAIKFQKAVDLVN